MRRPSPLALPLVFILAACSAEPAAQQPDAAPDAAAPCGGSCGPGTTCSAGRCVAPPLDGPGVEVDAAEDAAAPPDAPPEVGREAGADAGVDLVPDAAPDAGRDATAEQVDAGPDAPPADPLLEQVSAVRVTASVPGVSWESARAQSCSVAGDVVSIGAEYALPSSATFTAMGPLSGPVVLTVVTTGGAASDVRATVRRGAEYTTGGGRRVNVAVRGMPGANPLVDVIALGCVVR